MKRITFIFAMAVIAINVMAEGHMKFKGVEIDGNIQSFERAMHKQGFSTSSKHSAYRGMQGLFGGEDVVLWVYASPKTETMRAVTVIYGFDPSNGMKLKERYDMMKGRLIKKYGIPTDVDVKDDIYCYCKWNFEYGGVILKAHSIEEIRTAIGVTYWDRTGEEINEAERSEDL